MGCTTRDLPSTCIVVVPSGLVSPPPGHTCNLCQMPGPSGGLQGDSVKGVRDRGEHDRGTHEKPNNTSDILVARVAGSGSVCWRHLLVAVPTSHHTTASLLLLMHPTLHSLDDASTTHCFSVFLSSPHLPLLSLPYSHFPSLTTIPHPPSSPCLPLTKVLRSVLLSREDSLEVE